MGGLGLGFGVEVEVAIQGGTYIIRYVLASIYPTHGRPTHRTEQLRCTGLHRGTVASGPMAARRSWGGSFLHSGASRFGLPGRRHLKMGCGPLPAAATR